MHIFMRTEAGVLEAGLGFLQSHLEVRLASTATGLQGPEIKGCGGADDDG